MLPLASRGSVIVSETTCVSFLAGRERIGSATVDGVNCDYLVLII